MGKHKLDKLIKEWRQIQEHRTNRRIKMGFDNVRIYYNNIQYYATITISRTFIIIDPNDPQIPMEAVNESRLEGFIEDDRTSLKLNRRFNKAHIKLMFKTSEQKAKAIIKIKEMIGYVTS